MCRISVTGITITCCLNPTLHLAVCFWPIIPVYPGPLSGSYRFIRATRGYNLSGTYRSVAAFQCIAMLEPRISRDMFERLPQEEERLFHRLEEQLWREDTRFDYERMDKLFAPDFLEFGGSGRIHNRQVLISVQPSPIVVQLPLPDFKARRLAPDVVQVTYNTIVRNEGIVQYRRRSSIWTKSAEGWVIRFHQGTPYQP